jgi:hypothetical protein
MANRPYVPQEWNVGDIITADKLNILEQAIYDIDEDVVSFYNFYRNITPLLNQTNNDKVLTVKDAHIVVKELSNLLPDGDAIKY